MGLARAGSRGRSIAGAVPGASPVAAGQRAGASCDVRVSGSGRRHRRDERAVRSDREGRRPAPPPRARGHRRPSRSFECDQGVAGEGRRPGAARGHPGDRRPGRRAGDPADERALEDRGPAHRRGFRALIRDGRERLRAGGGRRRRYRARRPHAGRALSARARRRPRGAGPRNRLRRGGAGPLRGASRHRVHRGRPHRYRPGRRLRGEGLARAGAGRGPDHRGDGAVGAGPVAAPRGRRPCPDRAAAREDRAGRGHRGRSQRHRSARRRDARAVRPGARTRLRRPRADLPGDERRLYRRGHRAPDPQSARGERFPHRLREEGALRRDDAPDPDQRDHRPRPGLPGLAALANEGAKFVYHGQVWRREA